jgi:glycosyltransferase involved in cell wall biosynthesis
VTETVSAVIAVYNGALYLGQCLTSVLAQSLPPQEVIVVDDGSTDGSAGIAESFGPAVTVLRQENAGQAAALAVGIARATGSCLAFNDADDLWVPQKQEWQLAALAADPGIAAVFGHTQQFVSPELGPDEHSRFAPRVAIMPGRLLQAALIRRSAFDRIGSINPGLRGAGATDWIARLAASGLRSSMLQQVVHQRRLHAGNYGRTHAVERDRNLLGVLRRQIKRGRTAPPGS